MVEMTDSQRTTSRCKPVSGAIMSSSCFVSSPITPIAIISRKSTWSFTCEKHQNHKTCHRHSQSAFIISASASSMKHEKKIISKSTIPNILTYIRLSTIPIIAVISLLCPPFNGQCAITSIIFIVASITDFFDGYLARKWKVISPMGIFLDPVADKLLIALSLIILSSRFPSTPYVTISSAIIILREIFISALREWMALRGCSAVVKVSNLGKLKTAMQMIAIALLLATPFVYSYLAPLGFTLLVLSAVLTIVSAVQYVNASILALRR